jgi:hypothetical protein
MTVTNQRKQMILGAALAGRPWEGCLCGCAGGAGRSGRHPLILNHHILTSSCHLNQAALGNATTRRSTRFAAAEIHPCLAFYQADEPIQFLRENREVQAEPASAIRACQASEQIPCARFCVSSKKPRVESSRRKRERIFPKQAPQPCGLM